MAMNVKFLQGTLEQYNSLVTKDLNTFYYVTEQVDEATKYHVYLGTTLLSSGEAVDALEAAIEKLNGGTSVEGSVDYKINVLDQTLKAIAKSGLASDVALTDASGLITAENVEGALAEIVGRIAANEEALTVLGGSVDTAGSVDAKVKVVDDKIGALAGLATTDKDTVVDAINELKGNIESAVSGADIVIKTDVTTQGALKSYRIFQGGEAAENLVGTIDIPKDMVVQSGSVVTLEAETEGKAAGTYIKLILANATNDEIWIPVDSLIEYVTSGSQASDMVVISINDDHQVTASITDGTVTKAKLHADVQASLGLADSAVQSVTVAGHVLNDGGEVTVEQLKSDLGLEELAAGATTKYFEATSYEGLANLEAKQGDIAIVKAEIAPGKFEHTAYMLNEGVWKALDGNYNASNIYFDENLTYTAPIGVLTVPSSGAGQIEAQGKSLEDVLKGILAKEKNPTTTQPTVKLASTNIGAKEVGENVALNFAFTTTAGSYTYGPATGVTFSGHEVSLVDTKASNTVVVSGTGASGTLGTVQVVDGMNYQLTGTVDGTQGAMPKTNLNNDYAAGRITAKEYTANVATRLTGYRGWFCGYKSGANAIDAAAINSAQIRSLTKSNGSFPAEMSTNMMKQMFFAIPASANKTKVTVSDATNGAPQTVTKITGVMVEGANGYDAVAYDVWYVDNAAAASGTARFKIVVA